MPLIPQLRVSKSHPLAVQARRHWRSLPRLRQIDAVQECLYRWVPQQIVLHPSRGRLSRTETFQERQLPDPAAVAIAQPLVMQTGIRRWSDVVKAVRPVLLGQLPLTWELPAPVTAEGMLVRPWLLVRRVQPSVAVVPDFHWEPGPVAQRRVWAIRHYQVHHKPARPVRLRSAWPGAERVQAPS